MKRSDEKRIAISIIVVLGQMGLICSMLFLGNFALVRGACYSDAASTVDLWNARIFAGYLRASFGVRYLEKLAAGSPPVRCDCGIVIFLPSVSEES